MFFFDVNDFFSPKTNIAFDEKQKHSLIIKEGSIESVEDDSKQNLKTQCLIFF